MSILKDIVDILKDRKLIGDIKGSLSTKQASISRRASEGTLQFAVLITKSLDIDTAQMISKALERNFSSFVQIVFSMNPVMNTDKGVSGSDFIKQFHQNSGTKPDHKELAKNVMDVFEGYERLQLNDNVELLSMTYESTTASIMASHREQMIDLMDYVRKDILNNKYIPKSIEYRPVRESNDKDLDLKTKTYNLKKSELEYRISKDFRDRKDKNDSVVLNQNMLKDNDVRKANELIPTTLHVRIKLISHDGSDAGFLDFMVGIKSMLHPINSTEMINNLVGACQNNDKIFNFIRWTTGEISFFKDFLFNIQEIKNDISNRSMGSSPWWIALKRRKSMAKIKDTLFMKNKMLPNATIVTSIEEVEKIKVEYGFDLMDRRFVEKIMSTYFLLGFVIVDNSSQIAHFLFDGQESFNSVSFSGLEKENSRDERKFKEMLKAINRN